MRIFSRRHVFSMLGLGLLAAPFAARARRRRAAARVTPNGWILREDDL